MSKRHTVMKDRVVYFVNEASPQKKANRNLRPKPIVELDGMPYVPLICPVLSDSFSILTRCRLCSLHAIGKKRLFVNFVKSVRMDIKAAAVTYRRRYDNGALFEFIRNISGDRVALARMQEYTCIWALLDVIHGLFGGQEVCSEGFGPIDSDCEGKLPPFVLHFAHLLPTSLHYVHLEH